MSLKEEWQGHLYLFLKSKGLMSLQRPPGEADVALGCWLSEGAHLELSWFLTGSPLGPQRFDCIARTAHFSLSLPHLPWPPPGFWNILDSL